jgi:hypothetical protein
MVLAILTAYNIFDLLDNYRKEVFTRKCDDDYRLFLSCEFDRDVFNEKITKEEFDDES